MWTDVGSVGPLFDRLVCITQTLQTKAHVPGFAPDDAILGLKKSVAYVYGGTAVRFKHHNLRSPGANDFAIHCYRYESMKFL